jgi:aminoglycoside 3'-phosphotransferase-2
VKPDRIRGVAGIDGEIVPLLLRQGWDELSAAQLEPVTEGMSGAALFRVSENKKPLRYLKIARDKAMPALRREIERTAWLATRGIRVPAILRVEEQIDQIVMLTQAIPGSPADASTLPIARLANALATGLAALHSLDPVDCPFDESLAVRIDQAAKAVASGEVDPEAFEPRNRGTAPETLLARLAAHRPPEDIVVVHGDATMANLLVDTDGTIGFVDCGNAGRGDRYIDLAVLSNDIADYYGADAAARFAQSYSQRRWDSTKARFFSDLYELF